jgi:hypothetical protein
MSLVSKPSGFGGLWYMVITNTHHPTPITNYQSADSGQRIKKKVNNLKRQKKQWQELILTNYCRLAVTLAT